MFVVALVLLAGVASGRRPPQQAQSRPPRDVLTTQGVVRGYLLPRPPHYAYLGIPYARPPTGKYRFKAPAAPPRWDGIFEAKHRVKCPQPGEQGDENCLVINVFAPQHASDFNVLVHVHDGHFKYGWGSYEPPARLLQQEIVIVTFNYRLGALGFLSLGMPSIRGNAGLKDQVAALYWVHKNIAKFGGNPLSVTLYGTGSGAASVEMLLQSGLTTELIHRVILESGSILSPTSIDYYPYSKALNHARRLGYNGTQNAQYILNFYTKLSVKKLLEVDFLPIIENVKSSLNTFIDNDPKEALEKYHYQDVPILSVYLTNEKNDHYPANMKLLGKAKTIFPCNLKIDDKETRNRLKELITDFYSPEGNANDTLLYLMEFINDVETIYPIVKAASTYASKSTFPVFFMEVGEPPESEKTTLPDDKTNYISRVISKYIYSVDNLPASYELKARRLAMLWSNFIKFGDPTPLTTTLLPEVWQPANHGRRKTASISTIPTLKLTTKFIMTKPSSGRLEFLDRIYTSFYKPNDGATLGDC